MLAKRLLKILNVNTVEQRNFCLTVCLNKALNKPLSANELPRPAGISSMFRLPVVSSTEGAFALRTSGVTINQSVKIQPKLAYRVYRCQCPSVCQ